MLGLFALYCVYILLVGIYSKKLREASFSAYSRIISFDRAKVARIAKYELTEALCGSQTSEC